jgi:hypothetical protein
VLGWLRALAVTVVGLAVLVWLVPTAPLTGDGAGYVAFVRNDLQHGASSWHERRLLGPAIVRAMPLDALDGFRVLTLVSLAVTALLTWRAASHLMDSETKSLVAIPFLLGTWVVAPNLREYALVDPLAWAFVAAVWLCTVRRQWVLAGILAAVGVLAKEVVVLAALGAAVAAWDPKRKWLPLVILGPSVALVLALTVLFPGSGSDALAYVGKWVNDGLGSLGFGRVLYLVFASYGVLWLTLRPGLRHMPPDLRRGALVYVLAAPLLPFIGSPERMEELVFPAFVGAGALATIRWPTWLAWTVALCNVLFVARVGGDANIPTIVAWGGLAVAVVLVFLAGFRPELRAEPWSTRRAAATGPRGTTVQST